MRQDERAPFVQALQDAREAAYPPGEFAGQESFMTVTEIRELARRAGIGPGVPVLDLCCGVAGPGRLVTAEFGCEYLGLDYSDSAVAIARERTAGLPCRFEAALVPPLPPVAADFGPDVVLLLETMLAFDDKDALLQEISKALPIGGRFACTVEEGRPLTAAETASMPDAETVRLVPRAEWAARLAGAGLRVTWQQDVTAGHARTALSLLRSYAAHETAIVAGVGRRALDELLAAHLLWGEWLTTGRVRKFALVAEKR